MIYAKRDADGKIVSVSLHRDDEHTVGLPSDAKELVDFLQELAQHQAQLSASDLEFVRVLEDLIGVMIQKELLCFTDLPEQSRTKIIKREMLRGEKVISGKKDGLTLSQTV